MSKKTKKPIFGYIDSKNIPRLRKTQAIFFPISMFFIPLTLRNGMDLLSHYQRNVKDPISALDIAGVIANYFLTLVFILSSFVHWRLALATRPNWKGDRWFQPKPPKRPSAE